MKTKHLVLTLGLMFVTIVAASARQLSLGPGIPLSAMHTGYLVKPQGHQPGVTDPKSVVEVGVWYTSCPAMPNMSLGKASRTEVTLSNGKRIMLACKDCLGEIEGHLGKYAAYMYL